jgi:hypothetical protein
MTSKKTHPTSKKTLPAKAATTIATGSAGLNDPAQAAVANMATVHDLVGVAVLILPPDVRTALGDQNLLTTALELETQEILVIAREEGVVAYIHLPIVVKEMELPATELKSGMVLHDITGKHARQMATDQPSAPVKPKAKPKAKAKAKASTATKPSGKAGRHA